MEKEKVALSIVVAMTEKGVIGKNGGLPWKHLPSDMTRFRERTLEIGTVIMGYSTYVSIIKLLGKPLPRRRNIVLTRKHLSSSHAQVEFVRSPEEALAEVAANGKRACVIGGGEIYRLFLPLVMKAYVTTVYAPEVTGDVTFPTTQWQSISNSAIRKWDPRDAYETSFGVCSR